MNWLGLTLLGAVGLLAGCGRGPSTAPAAADSHEHVHHAPHGGWLVELEHETANLELVLEETTGMLEVYVLDAHAENFVRVAQPSLRLQLRDGAEVRELVLPAVANPATGETVGQTSLFRGQADWLRGRRHLAGVVGEVVVQGRTYRGIEFQAASENGAPAHPPHP